MPAEGIEKKLHSEMLTEEEMIQAVEIAAELGVTKLRITGGEPLVKKNILSICERASSVLGIEDLAITTNGILLPEMAAALKVCGVKRVNISLDTLNAGKYRRMTKCGDLDAALAGLHAALECGFEKVKVNAVLIGGFNDDEIPELADITRELPVDLRFIELMPMPCQCEFGTDSYIPCSRVNEALPELEMLDETDSVARMFRLPKARGRIGLISPLSAHFCGDCDRLRLTADGKIKPCLHSSQEYSIKGWTETESGNSSLRLFRPNHAGMGLCPKMIPARRAET